MPSLLSLAPELHLQTLSYLPPSSLLSISLISSQFTRLSQLVLHSSLTFDSQLGARRWLNSTMREKEGGEYQYVTSELKVVGMRRDGNGLDFGKGRNGEGICKESLRAILKKVRGLRSLEVHCMDSLSPAFLLLPNLKNLSSLTLSSDFRLPPRSASLPPVNFQPYFRLLHLSLHLTPCISFLPILLRSSSLSSLESVEIDPYTIGHLATLLSAPSSEANEIQKNLKNVQKIYLDLFPHPANNLENFSGILENLKGLRTVEVRGECSIDIQRILGEVCERSNVHMRMGDLKVIENVGKDVIEKKEVVEWTGTDKIQEIEV